ncbi:serine-threonine protein kinase [Mycolicibacterium cosmeticum]|uniref:alpha/beta fold hydrolase n=1 Tax=Mycolicibacterium cosmeticum TaxID=258533 RepID=UPI00320493B0
MAESLTAAKPGRLVFDKDGDIDEQTMTELIGAIRAGDITDLVLFSHGWNNDEAAATSLYRRWFELLDEQVGGERKVRYVGIRWPAQLWRDEPIPGFEPAPAGGHHGGAALDENPVLAAGAPTIDPVQLADLKAMFPSGAGALDEIATLLGQPPGPETARRLFDAMRAFSDAVGVGSSDGEAQPSDQPGMLDEQWDPNDLFTTFADRLADTGVEFGGGGGGAGLGDFGAKLLHGAKEALRQLSYWQMKNRAGVVGQRGLGPAITRLVGEFPQLRVHLVGHSFGARVVSFALAGLAESTPSAVKSVTLLQGAYSRFAFCHDLPFGGHGALDGKLARIDGPLTVCFSSHDRALSLFYPLASAAAGDATAGVEDPLARFRAMGQLGAFNTASQPLGDVGASYPFQPGQILNLDASDIVIAGDSPSGAHSDIFHKELAWVVASAAGLSSE